MPSASNIIQAPLSALLEYSGILRGGGGRSSHQETESLIGARLSGFRDRLHGQVNEPTVGANEGEVSIRIIGATEQEHDREGTGLVVGQARELGAASTEVVSAQSMASPVLAPDATGDSRADRGVGEGISQTLNGNGDADGGDGGGANGRDSSYQRYDIQQAARWIEQVLPFSLLLLVVFIRQHLQGISAISFVYNSLLALLLLKLNWCLLGLRQSCHL